MVARLLELKAKRDLEEDYYLSDDRARVLEARLTRAVETGRPTLILRLALAREYLAAGSPEVATALLAEALDNFQARAEEVHPGYRLEALKTMAEAWMRVGEQRNCVLHHGTDSCLAPISGSGRHADAQGSEEAMAVLRKVLAVDRADYEMRWLYNIAAMTVGKWPTDVEADLVVPPASFQSEQDSPRFRDTATACGLACRGLAGGACLDDFNGDGTLDIVTSEWPLDRPMRSYFNSATGQYTETSSTSGLAGLIGGANLLHADIDNDGDLDLLVLRGALRAAFGDTEPLSLLSNNGSGTFCDITEAAGLIAPTATQTAAIADFDGDGWLDIFVGNESTGGALLPCMLFRGSESGGFLDVASIAGVDLVAHVKGCASADYDNDGDQDLVVTRLDGSPVLFRNDGASFTDVSANAGLTLPSSSSLCWWADYDNDGLLDLFLFEHGTDQGQAVCRDYLGMTSDGARVRLYANTGYGGFTDVTQTAGLWRVLPAIGGNTGDIDNDGWLDFYVGTGEQSLMALYPNRTFRNENGMRFLDVTTATGMGHLQKGSAVTFGDVDNDGDQDVFVIMGGYYPGDSFHRALFENPGNENSWVTLVLEGTRANRSAIGARIRVRVIRLDGSVRDIHHVIGTGGSMGSQSLQAEVGLGDATAIQEVEVRWPGSGTTQVFARLPMRRFWKLREDDPQAKELTRRRTSLGGT